MSSKKLLYVDESGHSGANYLDRQPFHVAAGWLFGSVNLPAIERAARDLQRKNEEFKGSQLVKRESGRRRAVRFLEKMGAAGAVPFFVLIERRFSIAGKFVEVFMDPLTNEAAAWIPTIDPEARRLVAESLSDTLPAVLLERFASEYRAPSVQGFRDVLGAASAAVATMPDRRILETLDAANSVLEEIVKYETYGDGNTKHNQWAALNVPALGHLLRLVDTMLDVTHERYDVFHDEQSEFEPAFKRMVTAFSRPAAEDVDVVLADGRVFRGAYRNLDTFQMVSSTTNPAIQAADCLAAVVAKVAGASADAGAQRCPHLRSLARLTLPALMHSGDGKPEVAGFYGHERTYYQVMRVMFDPSSSDESG